jgi:4-diphosphocytidyl-2-C-methyl-D-erythritol kinase
MKLKAKAKINLFFHIVSKRPDQYHEIQSLVAFTHDVYDEIQLKHGIDSFTSGEFNVSGENLIDKVLGAFVPDLNYGWHLNKNIPVGAGLGGGSSDAAAVAKLIAPNIDPKSLVKFGADLPICFHDAPAFCLGIGEKVIPVNDFPKLHVVLVNPRKPLLTTDVFKLYKSEKKGYTEMQGSFFNDTECLLDFLIRQQNDLTEPAIVLIPEINEILELISVQKGCKLARMSGSGPTCFGLFDDIDNAKAALLGIIDKKPEYWVKYSLVG